MYLDYYGFSDKPFALTPDPKFLYLTKGHKEALAAVWRGVEERKGLMILTGEVGTGKTMLIHSILGRLPQNVRTAFIFHSTYKFRELLEQVFSELGETVSIREVEELKRRFIIFLRELKTQGGVLAVFIDEAQHLSEEVIREFLSLFRSEPWITGPLQLVLVGQPELDANINNGLLRYPPPKGFLRMAIHPLTMQESLEYIEHRLRIVGSSSKEIFSSQALALMTEFARGIPRVLNIVGDNALLAGYGESLKKIEVQHLEKVFENLEGPDYKKKHRDRITKRVASYPLFRRLSFRQGLIILMVFFLGAGIFLARNQITERRSASRGIGDVKSGPNRESHPVPVDKPQKTNREESQGQRSRPEANRKTDRNNSLEPGAPLASQLAIRTILIKNGETLSFLCIKYYGEFNETLIDLLIAYNPSIKNADLVLVNQKIQLPEKKDESILTLAQDNRFTIHLGTFKDPAQADKFKTEPALKGRPITIQPKKVVNRQTWYRVEAGKYDKREEALEVIIALKKKGLLPFFK